MPHSYPPAAWSRFLACLMVLFLHPVEGVTAQHVEVVRVLDPTLAITLHEVREVSASLRAVLQELERSDLILHVVGVAVPHLSHLDATMRFARAAGGRRFVRITINLQRPPHQRAAALADELLHAAELGRAGWVTDAASFAALYRTIGRAFRGGGGLECYETDEALRFGDRVMAEMRERTAR